MGDTGFIGKNFKKYYLSKGKKVDGVSLSKKFNLTNKKKLKKKLKEFNPDFVINCAARVGSLDYVMRNPAKILHLNMKILLNIYKVISELEKKPVLVNLISNCAYPGKLRIQNEGNFWEGIPHASSLAFGSTRRFITILNQVYKKQYNVITKNFILPGVYGPGDHTDPNRVHALDGLIIRMMDAQKNKNKSFEIWGSGKPIREWIYVEDVVKLIDKFLMKNPNFEIINLAQKKGYTILEITKIIKKYLKYDVKFINNYKYSDGDSIKILDNKLFKKYISSYKYTPLEIGIKKTIKYYRSVLK